MKKHSLLLFAAFTVPIFVVGCSENPALSARYRAEKLLFEAERASRSVRAKPELTTPELSQQLHDQYGNALQFCYRMLDSISPLSFPNEHGELTEIAFRAATRLSQLSFVEKRYDSSVAVLQGLMARAPLTGVPNVTAHLNLGRALQAAGQWDSALSVFGYSVDHFYPPADPEGEILVGLFGLPNHIYDVLMRIGD
ncbi:MAG: hypothetical protein NTW07_03680, partial [candidate division Zixibacteria bacterium]|nr:hypothetical protein [candidate division Zixibacteria bacterium]